MNICKAVLGATFKPNHDESLQATLNYAAQKHHLRNILMTSYFKDIKTVIEVFDKEDVVCKWRILLLISAF
ncbi:MAG: hypothetical protein VSS75_023785 [Candidatus Parabeggiatoa sp.]|nr:hypothetical protein [Candidatus Parabeggiatoa sp.]